MQLQLQMHSCVAAQVQIRPALQSPIPIWRIFSEVKCTSPWRWSQYGPWNRAPKVPRGLLNSIVEVSVYAEIGSWVALLREIAVAAELLEVSR